MATLKVERMFAKEGAAACNFCTRERNYRSSVVGDSTKVVQLRRVQLGSSVYFIGPRCAGKLATAMRGAAQKLTTFSGRGK
jgi:hypothetical protein